MKKLIVLALSLSIVFAAFAQTPDYIGNKLELDKNDLSSIVMSPVIGIIGDKLYCANAGKNQSTGYMQKGFEVYDINTLTETQRKVIIDGKKEKSIDRSVYNIAGNNIIGFTYNSPDKGDKTGGYNYFMVKYDATTLEPVGEQTDLFVLNPSKEKIYDFYTLQKSNKSTNGKYIAFVVLHRTTGDFKIAMADDKGNLVWKAEDNIKLVKDSRIENMDILLNDSGELVVKFDIFYYTKQMDYKLYSYDLKGEQVATAKFETNHQIIKDAKGITTPDGQFVIAGLTTKRFLNEDFITADGYFAVKFDAALKGLDNITKGDIKDANDKKGRGITTCSLEAVFCTENDDIVLVVEDYDFGQTSKGNRIYFYGDNYIITIGSKNESIAVVPKRNGAILCRSGHSGYSYYKDAIYIVCNESKENLNKGAGDKLEYNSCGNNAIVMLIKYDLSDGSINKYELAAKGNKGYFRIIEPLVIQKDNALLFRSLIEGGLLDSEPGGLGKITLK